MLHRFFLLRAFRPSLENNTAAAPAIIIVKMIVLILADNVFVTGSHSNKPLHAKLIKTTPPKTLFFFVGGITIAKNMPYNATLSALTAEAGKIFLQQFLLPLRMTMPAVQAPLLHKYKKDSHFQVLQWRFQRSHR